VRAWVRTKSVVAGYDQRYAEACRHRYCTLFEASQDSLYSSVWSRRSVSLARVEFFVAVSRFGVRWREVRIRRGSASRQKTQRAR